MAAPAVKQDDHKLSQIEPPPYQEIDLTQAQDETKLLKTLMSCVKAGQRYRGQYSTNWTDFTRKYTGDFYRNKQRFGFECRPNKYLEKVELQANLLTQEAFKDYVVREDQSNDPDDCKPEVFTRILADIKKVCKYSAKEYKALLMAGMYGPAIFKCFWNRELKNGRGYPDILAIDPRNFLVSPGCTELENAQYAVYMRAVSTDELRRLYPALKDRIKEDPGLSTNDLYGVDVVEHSGYAVSDAQTGAVAYLQELKQREGTGRPGDQAMLHEMWYRDPRWITLNDEKDLWKWISARPGFSNDYFKKCEYQERILDGFPQQVPLYPHGRLLFFLEGVKLEDHPNPYCRLPYFAWKNHIQPHAFWPKGQIELISEPMSNYHVISSSLSANWVFRSMPPWRTDDQTMDDNKFKKVQPNSLIKNKQGTTVEPLAVPAIPVQEGTAILQLRDQEADGVSGVSNLLGGARPQGVFAGSYFTQLQDSAFKVFGTLVKRLSETRLDIGNFMIWMIQSYLTDERVIPYMNDEDQEAAQNQQMTVNQQYVVNNPNSVEIKKHNNLGSGKFLYMCEEGTAQPYNLISRVQQANDMGKLMLAQGYEIPAFSLILQASGLPGWKAVLRQIEQQYQQKLQMGLLQREQQEKLTDQQRLDMLRVEEAKLSAKITAARLQAMSKVQTAGIHADATLKKTAMDNQPTGADIAQDGSASPEEVTQVLQASIARLLQEGVAPQDIQAIISQLTGEAAPPSVAPQPAPDTNLDPATPRIPVDTGTAPPMIPQTAPSPMPGSPVS